MLILTAGLLGGCGRAAKTAEADSLTESDPGERISVVATIFPEYDWVMNVVGDNPGNVEVTMLLDNGVDMHSFQPVARDIMKISSCDLFIYVGGESDDWVEDALKEAVNKDMVVLNLLDILGDRVREEEFVEGMQGGPEEDPEYDEHVWLSLTNAGILVQSISEAMQRIDPADAAKYASNAEAYIEKLNSLDEEYRSAIRDASGDTLLFGDRFAFRYMTDDYGLRYYAAFEGCSAETEASFETVMFLAEKTDELSLPCVLTLEGSDHRLAETIVLTTSDKDQRILSLDSMQSVSKDDVQTGKTYLNIMSENLEVLKEALR